MGSGERLRVGIIGCGEGTQALHLPTLNGLGRLFRISACCDVSPEVMHDIAARTGSRAIADPAELVSDGEVDVVLVATPDAYHPDHVIAACRAGKRAVLVEKPPALNSRMAREMAAAANASGVPVLVGYPHVYDPAVQRAREAWGPPSSLRYGEFRCNIGPNDRYTSDIVQTIRPSQRDRWPAIVSQLDYAAVATELLGPGVSLTQLVAYALVLGLTIHDLPVLRRIAGEPDGIEYARFRAMGGPMNPVGLGIDVLFAYGDGRLLLQTEIVSMKSIDWGFRLRRDGLEVAVQYPTTYAVSAPSLCTVRSERGDMTVDERHGGQYESGFRREWRHLHDVVTKGEAPLTPLADAVRDVELAERLVAAAVRGEREAEA